MSVELTTILMFAALLVLLASGLPVVFCMGAVGIIFGYLLWGSAALGLATANMFGLMTNFMMIAIPLFVFIAYMLLYSGVGENLYEAMYKWFGPVNGGLAIGTVVICGVIAAISGLSATGTLSMAIVSLPAMLKRNYAKNISIGSILAGGALGSLIPPSVPLIVYGFLTGESVGRLFLAAVLPGILLLVLYVVYIAVKCRVNPELGPALLPEERATWSEKLKSLKWIILPVLLILGVLGSIFTGIATPTEAAGVGAFGSILCTVINRRFTWDNLKLSLLSTLRVTGMVLWIIVGASIFTAIYTGLGASDFIKASISAWNANPFVIIAIMQISLFLLGMIMDPNGITMITVPIYAPIVASLGFDLTWFGVLFVMNMECGYLTPPFGWNIFYMKSVAPKGVTTEDIYRAVWAFICLQVLGLVLIIVFPQIALWLPSLMRK